jgi:hypothetical protein
VSDAVCAICGRREDEPPPTWTVQTERGRRQWICDACTREHLRSIEARLDSEWW